MHILSIDNTVAYLRERNWFSAERVTELAGGVSNLVLRVADAAGNLVVLKQACPQLRTADPWFSDVTRVLREVEVMRLLGPLLPAGVVPAVLEVDAENFTFLMSHAPLAARDWRTVLLAGEVDPALGFTSGQLLGRIHQATHERPDGLATLTDDTIFRQLRVEPFYERIAVKHADLARHITPLIAGMATERLCLCHGDYSPKNLLLADGTFTLVDFETAYHGSPDMDLGFFLSHLLLKGFARPVAGAELAELTRRFWQGYLAEVQFLTPPEALARCIPHLAVCLLARVDGTSPVPYLRDEPTRANVRALGRSLFEDRPNNLEDVLTRRP